MILTALFILFLTAALAPLVHRAAREATGWLLALVPAGIFAGLVAMLLRPETFSARQESYEWVARLNVNLSLNLDGLSMVFVMLICGIGAFILIYAGNYLHDDRRLGRFYAYLMLFMSAMTGVVLADNLYVLFVFWEITSISSYLLIGWDHHRAESRKSALTALLVTVGGGLMMLAGLVLLHLASGETEISALSAQKVRESGLYVPIVLLIFAGAATKSAQFPFHFWLPGAMAAPTPVSAYLHSATMVKAGVYLLARMHPTLGDSPLWHHLLTSFGAVTMLLGAAVAITQKDLKRILAYSTVSVLGLLVMLLGIGTEQAILAAMVYLVAHSLYKGALFMGAGTLDHETGTRDITQLRGLAKLMPISAVVAVLAAASNAGMIPMLGFVAKELFYEAVLHAPIWPMALMAMSFAASVCLVVVGFMVAYRPYFGGKPMSPRLAHEAPLALWLGAAVLAGLSLALGLLPTLYGQELGALAASAVMGHPLKMDLALWHGLSPVLGLSLLTLAVGTILYFMLRARQQSLFDLMQKGEGWSSQRIYDRAFNGLMRFAVVQANIVQNGYLRNYILVIVATMIALVAVPILQTFPYLRKINPGELRMNDIVICTIILGAAVACIRIRSRLAIVAVLGSIGIAVMLLYVMFGAMDLALTQIMVETLTVILLVLVIYHLPRFVPSSSRRIVVRDAIISTIFGGVMTTLVLMSATLHPDTAMREFFVDNSYLMAHGRNVVNVILVDFRAFDTMGEITVLSVAGIGVFALLKIRVKKEK